MRKNKISILELFDLYIDTIDKCGVFLLDEEDECIENSIFEEFDIGAVSFLYEGTLLKLLKARLINKEIMRKSIELRNSFMELQNTDEWNVESVRTSSKWYTVLELSDTIRKMLNEFTLKRCIENRFE